MQNNKIYDDRSCPTIMQAAFSQSEDGHGNDQSWSERDDLHFEEAAFDQRSTQWLHNRVKLLEDLGRQNDAIALENEFILD